MDLRYAPRTPQKDTKRPLCTPDPSTEALPVRVREGCRSAPECFVIRLAVAGVDDGPP